MDASGPYKIFLQECADVDGDSYDDFVTYPYRSGARPNVYLNNRAGNLRKVPDSLLPVGPTGDQWTAKFLDSNGDRIQDLVYFSGFGCSAGQSCTTFQLWSGRRPLQLPAAVGVARRIKSP